MLEIRVAKPERQALDTDEQAVFAAAGQEAIDARLRHLSGEERDAFWMAVERCYNQPYNDAAAAIAPLVHQGGGAMALNAGMLGA